MTAPLPFTPRPYQFEAKAAIYEELKRVDSTILVLATGLGKSKTAGMVVADGVRRGRSILVLAHRDELIEQLRETFEEATTMPVGIELGKQRDASQPSLREPGVGRVVVSSVQTMSKRLDSIPVDAFDLLILDECHHSRATSWEAIIRHFQAKRLGLTATPERGDKKSLAEVFASVAYDMPLVDGIREGWLVPIHQLLIDAKLDLSRVKKRAGDFAIDQLSEVMESLEMLRAVAVPTVNHLEGRQALVFCVSVRHAELQAEAIREAMADRGMVGEVAVVTGKTPKDIRRSMFARYRRGEIKVLVGCEVFLEGTDLPTSSLGVMARPTMSRVLYMQMLGRLSRALPGVVDKWDTAELRKLAITRSAKPFALVLDFVDNSKKHSIVKATDLLGEDEDAIDLREAERILARGECSDILEALERARALRFAKQRERLAKEGDFFAIFNIVREVDRFARPMTAAQEAALARSDMPLAGLDRRSANQAMTVMISRREAALCNYKQARALIRWSLPLDAVERLTFEQARQMLDALLASNWRPRDDRWWRSVLGRAAA